jgi:hypothetical protein
MDGQETVLSAMGRFEDNGFEGRHIMMDSFIQVFSRRWSIGFFRVSVADKKERGFSESFDGID